MTENFAPPPSPSTEGGATPQQHDPAMRSVATEIDGVTRVSIGGPSGGTKVEQENFQRAEPIRPSSTGSSVETIRSMNNRPLSGREVKGSSIITLGDLGDTSVAAAKAGGYIRQNANGDLEETDKHYPGKRGANGQPAPEPQQQQQQDDHQTPAESRTPDLHPEAHGYATEAASKVGNLGIAAATRQLMETGRMTDNTAAQIATALGINPDEAHSRAEVVRAAYEAQAYQVAGPNGKEAMAWAAQAHPEMLKAAFNNHINNEDSSGYAPIVKAWISNLPTHNPDLILNSPQAQERGVRRESNGTITLDAGPHGRVDWATAMRLGLFSPYMK